MDTKAQLDKLAGEYNVKILFACETGSRAWGFPSPDSDFDIRFIYMHDRDWYLSLSERKDSIEWMDGDWDITGWDLRKCLYLLKRSNAPLIERFQSPVTYFANKDFPLAFSALIPSFYSPAALFYHHYSLARKFRDEMEDEAAVKLKAWFYMIRSLLSCLWVVERGKQSVLPMHLEGLMDGIGGDRRMLLRDMVALKSVQPESFRYVIPDEVKAWTSSLFDKLDNLEERPEVSSGDMKILDRFFLKMTDAYDEY